MFRTIIVPLDGSALAEQALPTACELARRSAANLTLVRVHVPPRAAMAYAHDWDKEIRGREAAYLIDVAKRLTPTLGVTPATRLVDGHAADAINEMSDQAQSPLVVMASHGLTGFSRFWIGSVTDALIGRANTPVLMVRTRDEGGEAKVGEIHTVIVPLDGSALAEEILPDAAAAALAFGARLELLRVVEPGDAPPVPAALADDALDAMVREIKEELSATAKRVAAAAPGLDVQARVLVADSPANGIIATTRAEGCELVAMTTRAAGLTRLVAGSVADKVIRAGPPMLLLLRPRVDHEAASAESHAGAMAHA